MIWFAQQKGDYYHFKERRADAALVCREKTKMGLERCDHARWWPEQTRQEGEVRESTQECQGRVFGWT